MPNGTFAINLSIAGVSISKTITRTADHPEAFVIDLPVGATGTLSTRTDNDTGVVTAANHGLLQGDKVDVYWAAGRRYGMEVSSVSGNLVTVGTDAGHVGAGDNFPIATTAVTIVKQVLVNATIDGDAAELIGVSLEYTSTGGKGHVSFFDAADDEIVAVDLVGNVPQVHDIAGGATNPFTGDVITYAMASNGSSTLAGTLKVLVLADSTP